MTNKANPFKYSILKVGSTDWTDEHSCNILTDDGQFVAEVKITPYMDYEQASAFAQELVRRYNSAEKNTPID